ncbi:MAG: aminoglycoside 6-adenylyltransferase [bacterium]|nr:aminoglycoside 6-adenylyltransferase [bacterium]
MRSEKEMYDLILDIANKDSRILAVYMNGSRTNVNAPKDLFQDYDIVYVVKDIKPFIEEKAWIHKFGEILYMQYPDESPYEPNDKSNIYGWLMQFTDGNRIDLHVETVEHAKEHITEDKLCKILMDKEDILPKIPEATDEDYYTKKPSEAEFLATCNEFWWCTNNVAKGLWREEIPYVQDMVNFHCRPQLTKLLSWKIGILTDYSVSVGKSGKYMKRWLKEEEWKEYIATYFGGDLEESWEAMMRMCDLFEQTAKYVGEKLQYTYHVMEAHNARTYLNHVKTLPKDAKEIW